MQIEISDQRKIYSIQEEFNKNFPWLKVEFFSKLHKPGGSSPKKQIVQPSKTLGECRTIHDTGIITITPMMTVDELEQAFGSVYGLSIQVFRKSGKSWLETTVTDNWTLEKQNEQGRMLSNVS
jgi:hypothetical protein